MVVSCIVSWLHFVYGAAINRRSSVMHRLPFSAWQGVMVPHVMWCAGHRPRLTDAASRPCSIDGGCLAALFDQCRSLDGLCGRERCLHALRDLFLKIQRNAACNCLRIVRFANGPKISMGQVLGAEKEFFLIRGRRHAHGRWRPRQLKPVNPCQLGVPGVA